MSSQLEELISEAKRLLKSGDLSRSKDCVVEALDIEENHQDALYFKAVIERYSKQYSDALATVNRLIRLYPSFDRAFQERGHIFIALNELIKALESYERAVSINPSLHACWDKIANIYSQLNEHERSQRAKNELNRLAKLPRELLVISSLFYQGKLYKAENLCRDFLKTKGNHPEAMRLLANIGVKLQILDDAEFLLENCLKIAPDFHLGRYDYTTVLNKRQKFEAALQQAEKLIEVDSKNPGYQTLYANACVAVRKFETSLDIFDNIIKTNPNSFVTYMSRGHVLKTIGNQDAAVSSYRNAYKIKESLGDAFWSLANLKTYRFPENEIDHMLQQESNSNIELNDRYHMCFALGKAFADRQQYDRSFEFYSKGNKLKKQELNYSPDRIHKEKQLQKNVFDKTFFENKSHTGYSAADPIFIVGLPRAGSTLLEQILASHSMVDGTLELPNILALAHRLNGRQILGENPVYPSNVLDLDSSQLQAYGKEYIEDTKIYRSGAPFFTDKMPNNFRHIGLIHSILPNAKIIDARRHPMACCFSGFTQLFAEGQEFTYGLDDIGQYYKDYVSLMDHWHHVLPGKILQVQYENVVSNIEHEVQRILDYCGLEFEQSCVDFHKTERAVQTASSEQVRQPLYQSGLEHWKHYEHHLTPLKDALGETG